jgi:hypothetical protein
MPYQGKGGRHSALWPTTRVLELSHSFSRQVMPLLTSSGPVAGLVLPKLRHY